MMKTRYLPDGRYRVLYFHFLIHSGEVEIFYAVFIEFGKVAVGFGGQLVAAGIGRLKGSAPGTLKGTGRAIHIAAR